MNRVDIILLLMHCLNAQFLGDNKPLYHMQMHALVDDKQ